MKSTFKRNLIIGFGLSLLILIASSVASFISIRNLLDGAEWVNHTNIVLKNLESILSGLKDAETNQRGFLLTGDADFLDENFLATESSLKAVEQVRRLTTDNPVQQESIDRLRELVDRRISLLSRHIEQKKANQPVSVPALKAGRDSMHDVVDLINTMRAEENRLLTSRTTTMNKFSESTPLLIVLGALLAMFITGMFYVQIKNDFDRRAALQLELERKDIEINRRINIIQGIAEKISAGDYATRVKDSEKDSLGNVAGAMNKMAESLEYSFGQLSDKEWFQTGAAKLNDLMIGEKDLPTLTSHVIEFLADYTKSQVAAFYLRDPDNFLRWTAGFAYVPDKNRTRIRSGEGLVGQAAASGKEIILKDISPEDIFVSFASGGAKPKTVVAIPVFDGRAVKGVIELATLHEFANLEIDFVKSVSHNIGLAISTAQSQKRLRELLDETQAQSEELQAQHNELENLNGELETQAEKLQASEEELKVQQEELLQANQEMEERTKLVEEKNLLITERNHEIQTKAEELALSTKYKSEFLANMSHELRTPLNSILLLSRLMKENDSKNLNAEQVEYARVIQSSGNGLLTLIDEILDLSKIEAGKMELEYEMMSVSSLFKDIKSLFEPVAKEKGLSFTTAIGLGLPDKIETDRMRLEQIIRNLISNALKFTAKGSIAVEVSKDKDHANFIIFSVKDTGIGIPTEKQQLIFEAFQQADGSTRRKYGGTGLGLSISRELAKLLGGEIRLKSEPGNGSEFVVYMPIARGSNIVIEDEPKIVPALPEKRVDVKKYTSEIIPESIPDDRNTIGPKDKCILIVEDDTNFAKTLLDYARKRGYKGIVAVRGDEGIALARKYSPLGILLDIQLPVKSGWEVMEDLKNDKETRHIPVHIMSSHSVKNESLIKGAVDFIDKPVTLEKMNEVFQKIEYVLSQHPKKVLIVEENAKHAKALAYFLESYGLTLEIKNSVSDGISVLKKNDVNCVILDMGIPDQKSYDTLEEVKRTPGLENIPIIIFTGKSLSKAEEQRIKQYADSIVVKTAHSYQRVVDEVALFLHLMEKNKQDPAPRRNTTLGGLNEVLKNKKVLIVDDDVRNLFSLTKSLENYKMIISTATDGKDAIRQLTVDPEVDVILMDMMMPEMDGYETTTQLRKDPKFKSVPIIAVTAKAMMGDRAKCMNAGASDYITKPVDADQLLSLLRVWLYEKN
jgi:signal transduction histidine kinase/CheY-like chemotaxis protein/CHASE3 domain sensor protein/HAMP domain-containing protein